MTRSFALGLVFTAFPALAQTGTAAGKLAEQLRQLEQAVDRGDWANAAGLSTEFRKRVEEERDRAWSATNRAQVDAFLRRLPADTETVVGTERAMLLKESNDRVEYGALEASRGYLLALLAAPEEGALFRVLQGLTLRFAVMGAKKFGLHPPDGSGVVPLGMIPYQGCALYGFSSPLPEELLPAGESRTVADQPVSVHYGKQHIQARGAAEQRIPYYFSTQGPASVLVCNDESMLKEVLLNNAGAADRKSGLPGWKYVNRDAPIWGLRHVSHLNNAFGLLGMSIQEPGSGLVLEVTAAERMRMLVLTESKDDPWRKLQDHSDFRGMAKSERLGQEGWELRIESGTHASGFGVFVGMALLGFVVII